MAKHQNRFSNTVDVLNTIIRERNDKIRKYKSELMKHRVLLDIISYEMQKYITNIEAQIQKSIPTNRKVKHNPKPVHIFPVDVPLRSLKRINRKITRFLNQEAAGIINNIPSEVTRLRLELKRKFGWAINLGEFHNLSNAEKSKGRTYLREKFGGAIKKDDIIKEVFRKPKKSQMKIESEFKIPTHYM